MKATITINQTFINNAEQNFKTLTERERTVAILTMLGFLQRLVISTRRTCGGNSAWTN